MLRYNLNFKPRQLVIEEYPEAVLNLTRWLESVNSSTDSKALSLRLLVYTCLSVMLDQCSVSQLGNLGNALKVGFALYGEMCLIFRDLCKIIGIFEKSIFVFRALLGS